MLAQYSQASVFIVGDFKNCKPFCCLFNHMFMFPQGKTILWTCVMETYQCIQWWGTSYYYLVFADHNVCFLLLHYKLEIKFTKPETVQLEGSLACKFLHIYQGDLDDFCYHWLCQAQHYHHHTHKKINEMPKLHLRAPPILSSLRGKQNANSNIRMDWSTSSETWTHKTHCESRQRLSTITDPNTFVNTLNT